MLFFVVFFFQFVIIEMWSVFMWFFVVRWCDTLITYSSIFSPNHLCVICFLFCLFLLLLLLLHPLIACFLIHVYLYSYPQTRECFNKLHQQIQSWIYGAIYFLLRLLIKLCMWFIAHIRTVVCDFFFAVVVRVGSIFVNWRKCFWLLWKCQLILIHLD